MAIDYGTKNIGLAISDPLGISAHPLHPYSRTHSKKDIDHIVRLVKEYSVSTLVIGLPLEMSGSEGEIARSARRFADEIKLSLEGEDVKIEFYDERLTTSLVERMLTYEADISRSKRRKIKDKLSAVVILQNYMDSIHTQSESENKYNE